MTYHAPHHHKITKATHPADAQKIARRKFAVIIICLIVFSALKVFVSHYYEPLANYLDVADHAALIADISFMFQE